MSDYAIGVDLGGTKIEAALIDRGGARVARARRPTHPAEGVEAVVGRIVAAIEELRAAGGPIAGIGVGVPGVVTAAGVVALASNLHWRDVPLRAMLIARLGDAGARGLYMEKDTNAAALGEIRYGAGQGARHMLYVTVGTGVGGGMVLDGRIYHGARDKAGEIGHLVIAPGGHRCGCGKRGCLETLASGTAIERWMREALARGEPSALAGADREALTAKDVAAAAQAGDALARRAFEVAGRHLGHGLALYADLVDPERIVIGGGVAAAGDLLFEPARAALREWAFRGDEIAASVVRAGLGPESGAIGAAALVWHSLEG
ncbi:MAG: ROK family protein [Anaerolineae bacterium]|nr:ROK family protein [Anaerolineae bacterium]